MRYGVAASLVALALAIKLLLDPHIEEESPFLLFFGAVMLASLYGGLGPGLLAAALAALAGDLFFLSAGRSSLLFNSAGENVRLGMFALEATLIGALSAWLRFARGQSESARRRYRELVDDLEGIVWEADARTLEFTFVSRQAERILGYPVVRWLGSAGFWDTLVHPEDRERAVGLRRAAIREGEDYDLEYRAVAADGRVIWLRELAHVTRDTGGRAPSVRGLLVDITERKRAEEALRRAEAKYRSIFENAVEGIFQSTTDGRLTTANPAMARMLGYESPEELLATITDVAGQLYVDPERREEFRRLMGQRDSVSGFEIEVYRKDGAPIWVSAAARAVFGETGEVVGYEGTLEDITGRKRAEEALRESEERYRAVVEQTAEGIFLFDVETKRILESNVAHRELLGYTAGELRRMRIYDIIAHEPQSIDANVRRTMREKRCALGERQYRRKDGSLVAVDVAACAIHHSGRELVCAAVRDLTERKRTERVLGEVRQAERIRIARELHDGVLQDLAYGLKEVEIVETISEEKELAGRLEQTIEALRRAGRGLRAAIYDLRLGDAQDQPFPRLLQSLVELNRRMMPECEIELVVEDAFPSTPLGEVGAELLRIFQEALANVRRHSGARRVRMELGVRGDELHAGVADDGRGFEPESVWGMGLTGMRERAGALGGELEVRSEPGKGSRVRFRTSMSGVLERRSNVR